MKLDKWMLTMSILILAFVGLLFAEQQQTTKDQQNTVAVVNGEPITKDSLFAEMTKANGSETLDKMITEKLVDQEAKKAGIKITDQDINKEVDKLKKQAQTPEGFQQMLTQYNITEKQLRETISQNLVVEKLLADKIKVSDDDISKYFDQNKKAFAKPEQVRASHILVKTEAEAQAIKKQLDGGSDFAQLAKEKSLDAGTKDKGGDLGYFSQGQMVPEFDKAAFALKPGEISGVVKSQYGYHIIKVTDKKAAVQPELSAHKDEIRDMLVQQKLSQEAPAWIQELHQKAKIENHLNS